MNISSTYATLPILSQVKCQKGKFTHLGGSSVKLENMHEAAKHKNENRQTYTVHTLKVIQRPNVTQLFLGRIVYA